MQLLINSVHTLLSYSGMTILYKVQVAGIWKSLPLLKHTNFALISSKSTPFLLNAQVTLGLYLLSTLLVIASSLILYFYGHTRFNEFLNRECQLKIITLKSDIINKWNYFTHCAALCMLISVGICYAPLLHDYTFVYKGSLDDIILASIIGGILHLFLWVVIWLFLTIRQKWIFKLRVVVGRASVKQARSVRLITDIDLSRNLQDTQDQPLLVVANGRTYGVVDVSPQKAIMNIVKKSTTVRKAIHQDATPNIEEDEEQIYWLRPALSNQQQSPDQAKQLCCFTKKEKKRVIFNETASTSNNRKTNGSKTQGIPRMDEDDGDYATLSELPLPLNQTNNNENDTVSEEGKLLACVHDENTTYACNNQDLNPPLDYEDPSPLLTPNPMPNAFEQSIPVVMKNASNKQSISSQTPRCLRRTDSGMPPEEMNSRSDSISTESSVSPPEAPESNHSESSSGIHSNDSREHKQSRRANSVVDLMQPPPREEIQWKSFSLQRNVQPPTSSNFNTTFPPEIMSLNCLDREIIPNVILEEGENTVIIRRKSCRPNIPDSSQTTLETFGRATNMRMVSFTEKTDLGNMQSTSATLPHYPTQPVPNIYPNCSTMPLPPHSNVQINNKGLGNSCNIYPRQHSTIPIHHNGVTVKMYNATTNQTAHNPHYIMNSRMPCKQDLKNTDIIYSRIYRNPNVYHASSS
ncbi:hypothetical protein HHI36_008079 [Cryptolaemus montrouzieri]|uniref:Protein tincar n=1 Tax=Cryptolaemus montrouzieri TaxID=559131 RepID=A0ABD2MRI2_9CUCU